VPGLTDRISHERVAAGKGAPARSAAADVSAGLGGDRPPSTSVNVSGTFGLARAFGTRHEGVGVGPVSRVRHARSRAAVRLHVRCLRPFCGHEAPAGPPCPCSARRATAGRPTGCRGASSAAAAGARPTSAGRRGGPTATIPAGGCDGVGRSSRPPAARLGPVGAAGAGADDAGGGAAGPDVADGGVLFPCRAAGARCRPTACRGRWARRRWASCGWRGGSAAPAAAWPRARWPWWSTTACRSRSSAGAWASPAWPAASSAGGAATPPAGGTGTTGFRSGGRKGGGRRRGQA
jgi:hypothetical protein